MAYWSHVLFFFTGFFLKKHDLVRLVIQLVQKNLLFFLKFLKNLTNKATQEM